MPGAAYIHCLKILPEDNYPRGNLPDTAPFNSRTHCPIDPKLGTHVQHRKLSDGFESGRRRNAGAG